MISECGTELWRQLCYSLTSLDDERPTPLSDDAYGWFELYKGLYHREENWRRGLAQRVVVLKGHTGLLFSKLYLPASPLTESHKVEYSRLDWGHQTKSLDLGHRLARWYLAHLGRTLKYMPQGCEDACASLVCGLLWPVWHSRRGGGWR